MMKIIKSKYTYISIFIFLLCLFFMNRGYSSEIESVKLVECSKSSAYLAWEKLSDEEKETTIMPATCDEEKNNQQYYNFTFDVKGNLPSSYTNKNTIIKNQASTGQCWAFSTTTALELFTKKQDNLTYTFSPRHIEYSSTRVFLNNQINEYGYNRSLGTGGHFYMSSNYLINARGPIAESEMPFENNEDKIDISAIQNKTTLVDVNNIVLKSNTAGVKCTNTKIQEIKELIYKNGAVLSTTYMTESSKYYNSTNAAYYYNGTGGINHAITLIGWDDNYSKTNFSSTTRPSSNGAWLVQNSYGTNFGKSGYYYISYEDVHICDIYMSIEEVDYEIEDNSYILDKLGYISFLGYENETTSYTDGYAMNVFTKEKKKEKLEEITFGTNGSGNYTIYYKVGKATTSTKISDMTEIGSGRVEYAGYVTHKLDKEILIDENTTNFSIAIYYDMDTSTAPIPVSVPTVQKYEYVTTTEGVSFASHSGKDWSDLAKREGGSIAIASIKAFTNNVDFVLKVNNYNISYDNNKALLNIKTTASQVDQSKLDIYIKNQNDDTISPLNIEYTNGTSLSQILISLTKPSANDTYNVIIYYDDEFIYSFEIDIAGTSDITSNTYTINQSNKLIYVTPKTSVSTFLNNINNEQGNIYKSTTKVTSGYVSTGMTIDSYTIIVKGDVTGDGYVKMNDVMMISQFIVEGAGVTEIGKKAADVTGDSNIKMNDVMKISQYIVEGGTL